MNGNFRNETKGKQFQAFFLFGVKMKKFFWMNWWFMQITRPNHRFDGWMDNGAVVLVDQNLKSQVCLLLLSPSLTKSKASFLDCFWVEWVDVARRSKLLSISSTRPRAIVAHWWAIYHQNGKAFNSKNRTIKIYICFIFLFKHHRQSPGHQFNLASLTTGQQHTLAIKRMHVAR